MGISVTQDHIDQFVAYARELKEWGNYINLTAITNPLDIAVKHFLDSLAPLPFIPSDSSLLDIGSGGGFPGIPLKVINPDLRITLIDASIKKVVFQKHVIRTLKLNKIETYHTRSEDFIKRVQEEKGSYDVVISRAFSKLHHYIKQASPFLSNKGLIIAMKGKNIKDEIKELESHDMSREMQLTIKEYTLPYLNLKRCLVIIRCVC